MTQPAPRTCFWRRAGMPAASAMLALAFAASLVPAAWAAGGRWTQEGRDAAATGFNPGETRLHAGNLGRLRKLWSGHLDVWNQATEMSVADGQVYIGRRVADPVTTVRYQLLSASLANGQIEWQVDTPPFFWTPVLTNDLVIIAGAEASAVDGAVPVIAYDRATGAKRWEYRTPPEGDLGFRAPHLANGVLHAVSQNGRVIALNAATGALRWTLRTGTGNTSHNGLAVAGGRVFVTSYQKTFAYDAADGRLLWTATLPPPYLQTQRPLVAGGSVLMFDGYGRLQALDPATGAQRWMTQVPRGDMDADYRPMASDGQRVFVSNGLTRAKLSAVDIATGAVVWTINPGKATRTSVVANGVLYIPGNRILAYDTATGAALPIARLQPSPNSQLVVVDGKLLSSSGPVMVFGLPPSGP